MSDHYGSIPISPASPAQHSQKPGKPPLKRQSRPRQKKDSSFKALFFAVLVVLCAVSYFVAGTYLVPLAIQKYLPAFIEKKTGLPTSIEEISFNPFNFQLSLGNLQADHPESTEAHPLLHIKSLFVDLDLTALIRNTFVCDKLTIQNLHLNIIRHKDNTYNIPALSQFTTQQEGDEIIAFSKLPFLFSLNNIDIHDSSALFTDRATGTAHDIKQLHLAIPTLSNFSFQSKNYITPHFSAIIDGSHVELSGKAMQLAGNQGFQTKLSCSIQSLDLAPYFSYLPATLPVSLTRGRADAELQITFSPKRKHGDRLSIDIKMTASNLAMKGKDGALKLDIPAMKIDAVLMPIGKRLHISSIIAKEPHLTWTRQRLNSSLQEVLLHFHNKKKPSVTIHVEQVLSDQGSLSLLDENNKESLPTEWNNIQLSIRTLRSDAATAIVNMSGERPGQQASFSWQSHFSDTGNLEGKILLEKLSASTLFGYLSPDRDTNIQGIATFSGEIHFPANTSPSASYVVSNGIAEVQDLVLGHKENQWLKAESIRFTRLTRTNERYNLGNIFLHDARLTLNPTKLPPLFNHLFTEDTRPLIQGIDYSGSIRVTKGNRETESLELSEVSFQVNNLEKAVHSDNFAFSAQPGTEGKVKAKGRLTLGPTQMQADMAFSNVNSSMLAALTDGWPLLKASHSTLHGRGKFSYPKPVFQGDLRLTNTTLQTTDETPLIRWKRAEVKQAVLRFSPFSMEVETLSLDGPAFKWIRDTNSPFKHLQNGVRTLLQNEQADTSLPPVTIKKTVFNTGEIQIVDKRLDTARTTVLRDIEGHVNTFSTVAEGESSFALNASLEDTPLTLSGTTTLFGSEIDGHAKLTLTGFPLASLAKDLQILPVETENATLDLHINMVEKQSTFSSSNKLFIHNLQPSSLQSDTATALAFLKNRAGGFLMNIHMKDGSRALLPEAVTTFQRDTIKASHAPLLLDRQFKDLQDRDLILFTPGSEQISPEDLAILGRYAELLVKHPGLGISITGMADHKIDHDVLLTRLKDQEQQRTDKENKIRFAQYQLEQERENVWTEPPGETLQEEDISQGELIGFKYLLPEAVEVAEQTLLDLAVARGRLVFDSCIHDFAVPQNRITLKEQDNNSTVNTPANGVHISIHAIATDQDK